MRTDTRHTTTNNKRDTRHETTRQQTTNTTANNKRHNTPRGPATNQPINRPSLGYWTNLTFFWAPEQKRHNSRDTPGVNWNKLSAMPANSLNQSYSGPFLGPWFAPAQNLVAQSGSSALQRGPLKRALYIRANHKGPTVWVTEKVPHLAFMASNVPHLVMSAYLSNGFSCWQRQRQQREAAFSAACRQK